MAAGSVALAADSEAARANAAVVRAFFRDVLAGGAPGAARSFLTDDFVDHDPAAPGGPEAVAAKLAALWRAFPDGRFELLELVAAGDRVAARSRLVGTQTGAFGALAPSGRPVDVAFFDLYRIERDRIAEHWHVYDEAGLLRALTSGG